MLYIYIFFFNSTIFYIIFFIVHMVMLMRAVNINANKRTIFVDNIIHSNSISFLIVRLVQNTWIIDDYAEKKIYRCT